MRAFWAVLMSGATLVPVAGHAQDAADAPRDERPAGQPGEIIVTAQRFEQRLQDVPLSVSVVGADELRGRAVTGLVDLQYSVPGLSAYEFGAGRQTVQLRGIATTIGASTVGFYLDETPLSLDTSSDSFNVRLIDLERVEVLRGPQATLYGNGSMGGTIRYIPAAPRLDAVSGSVTGEYSSTRNGGSGYKAVGVLNIPLATDVAAVRLAAGYERVGGFIDSAVTGKSDINFADFYTIRGSLLVKPSDRLSLSLMGLYQKSDQPNQDIGIGYRTGAQVPTPGRDRYTLIQSKVGYDLDFAQLDVSTSYIDRHNFTQFDASPFFVPVLNAALGLPSGYITQVGLPAETDFNIYNSEVRLGSQDAGPFGWQVGINYTDMKIRQAGEAFTGPGTLPFAIVTSDDQRRTRSYAAYGEVNYAIMPQLRVTIGLRHFRERKTRTIASTNFGVESLDIGNATFETLNPRFNLSYEISPISMVFANVAKGFRSGGFNQTSAGGGVFPVPPTYAPDRIWTYELGTKHQLLDKRLDLEASVYRSEWSNVQSSNFAPGNVITIINNSGRVSGWGVDFTATARPAQGLVIDASYGWNNLEFDEATADKAVGDPVDAAVRESWSASLDYRPRISEGATGIFRIDYQHAGRSQFTFRNLATGSVVERPKRDLVNLRVGAAFGQTEVTVFANNLFNEKAPTIVGPFSTIFENIEQRPRVIGISATAQF